MRYPNFAAALRSYGSAKEIQARLGIKSRAQVFEYLGGRSLPRAEKILPFPDLIEAARRDVVRAEPGDLVAA
jgi:hypothetical protein